MDTRPEQERAAAQRERQTEQAPPCRVVGGGSIAPMDAAPGAPWAKPGGRSGLPWGGGAEKGALSRGRCKSTGERRGNPCSGAGQERIRPRVEVGGGFQQRGSGHCSEA